MRLELRGDTLLERLALRTPLLPLPAVQTVAGMALSGALIASTRLGLATELAGHPATTEELASRLTLRTDTARLLLDALQSLGYLKIRHGRYTLTRRAKRWLLPSSDVSVNHVMASMENLWPLWMDLPAVARGKEILDHHAIAPDDEYWHDYITGQYEMARLTAPETVAAIRVPPQAHTVLDIAGGHGHFATELCRRHPALRATVLDLPGSAAVGRDIVRQAGAGHVVTYREGDVRTTDLGTNYDVVLCFNLIHHLQPDEIPALFRRVHTALRPGGTFAVLGMFLEPGNRRRPRADECARGLLFHLTSDGTLCSPAPRMPWPSSVSWPSSNSPRHSHPRPPPASLRRDLHQRAKLPAQEPTQGHRAGHGRGLTAGDVHPYTTGELRSYADTPGRGHEIRQACRPLRGDRVGGSPQRVAVTNGFCR